MDQDSRSRGVASPKFSRSCSSFRRWEMAPIRYLKLVGGKMVVAALRMMYPAARSGGRNRRKVTSSSENATKTPPPPPARLAVDSHRDEAVKDCIHFMNNISSVPRSNSISCKP